MDNKIVLMVVVAIVLGMLVANMFKDVCGCKVVEGQCERCMFKKGMGKYINYRHVKIVFLNGFLWV